MIYIFDDKRYRQVGYNWTGEKFDKYEDFILNIYQYSQVQDDVERKKIFSEGNVVLFHESFFDADSDSVAGCNVLPGKRGRRACDDPVLV